MIILAASAAFLLSAAVESQAFAMTRGHHPAKFNSTNGVPVLNTSISCATIRSYAKDMNNETKQKYRKMASPEQISAARRCL
jgi:hypothetical protein